MGRTTKRLTAVACLLMLAMTGCDKPATVTTDRLTSGVVELPDGRTVVCVREIGTNTRFDCDWATAS